MKLTVVETPIKGVVVIEPAVFADSRGFFMETWNERAWAEAGVTARFVQDSQSRSGAGVVRGLHFQDGRAPVAKLVRCTAGRIFDVVVDLRAGSPTFGQWFGAELSAENRRQLFLPVGLAHGFQALTDGAEIQYKQTAYYTPAAERTLAWDDPELAIAWPIAGPVVSDRDRRGGSFKDYRKDPIFTFDVT